MTLTATLVTEDFLIQVSDRRVSSIAGTPLDDETNKSVVVRCADGVVALTYTGLASVPPSRVVPHGTMDQWLAARLLEMGSSERRCDDLITSLRQEATTLFAGLPKRYRIHHSFIVAGLLLATGRQKARPRLSLIDNIERVPGGPLPPATDFQIHDFKRPVRRVLMAGASRAVDRFIRRHLRADLRSAESPDAIEDAMVRAIRGAAAHPAGSVIGRSCLAIQLAPSGMTNATYYGASTETPPGFSPYFVWYEGGANYLVGRLKMFVGPRYGARFGGPRGLQLFVKDADRPNSMMPAPPFHIGIETRRVLAKHRVGDPVESVQIAEALS